MTDAPAQLPTISRLDAKHSIVEKIIAVVREHTPTALHGDPSQLSVHSLRNAMNEIARGETPAADTRAKVLSFFTPEQLQRSRKIAESYLEGHRKGLADHEHLLQGRTPAQAQEQLQKAISEKVASREPIARLGQLFNQMQHKINSPGVPGPKSLAEWSNTLIELGDKAQPAIADLILRTTFLLLPTGTYKWKKIAKQLEELDYTRGDRMTEVSIEIEALRTEGHHLATAEELVKKIARASDDIAAFDAIADGVREIYRTAFLAERLEAEPDLQIPEVLDAQINDAVSTLSPAGIGR